MSAGGVPTGAAKIFSYKKSAAPFGTAGGGGAGAQIMRRVEATFETEQDTMESDEITPTFQTTDLQPGQQRAKGTLRARLSGKTHQDLVAALVRQAFQVAPTTGALINVTAAAAGPQFVRAAGSFITDGFRVWDLVQWVGWTAPAAANNNRYFLITALTATNMTGIHLDGTPVTAKAAGDNVTCTLAGKKTWIPQAGHTFDLFDFEEYQPDMAVTQSELWVSMYAASAQFSFDPKNYVGIDYSLLGCKQQNTTGAPYFAGPTAATSTRLHNVLDGKIYVGGTLAADVTGANFTLDSSAQLCEPTYGSRNPSDVMANRFKVSGQLTAYWRDSALRDAALAGTKVSVALITRTGVGAQADSAVTVLPSTLLTSSPKNDGQAGIIRTYQFMSDNNLAGSGSDQTTLSFQDTQAA